MPKIKIFYPLSLVTASLLICIVVRNISPYPQTSSEGLFSPPPPEKSVEIGIFYLKKKNYKAALSRFLEAIKTNPLYPPAHRQLGKVYEKLGKKEEALKAYKAHLESLPSSEEAEKAIDVRKVISRLELDLRRKLPKEK